MLQFGFDYGRVVESIKTQKGRDGLLGVERPKDPDPIVSYGEIPRIPEDEENRILMLVNSGEPEMRSSVDTPFWNYVVYDMARREEAE